MKDSGIDWIGKIPDGWKIEKGKRIFAQRNERGNKINLELLSPTQKYGVIPQTLYEELTTYSAVKLKEGTDLSQLKTVHKGDYCISLRSFQGGFEYSKYEGVVSPAYQIFYAIKNIDECYYKYLFKDQTFIAKMNSFTMSLRDGKNIAFSDFGNTYIPLPPLSEQTKIANFLDKKCAQIDSIIEESKKSIEEYKSWKQSMIFEAVTGKNLSCKKKDSGIDWIRKIPDEWEVCKLKYLLKTNLQYGANSSGIEFNENLPRYVRITDIKSSEALYEKGKLSLSEEDSIGYLLQDGDILFARSGATVGKTFLYHSNIGKAAFAGYLIRAQLNENLNPKFLSYYTLSSGYDEWKNRIFIQATIQNIGADKYANMEIPFPPLSEQESIAKALDAKCVQIDSLISEKQSLIKDLAEYKKSLIFEAVTGKRRV